MISFENLEIPASLVEALLKIGISKPTSIQASSIPFILREKDILASAQTGTGKTLAYILPLVTRLLHNPKARALILVPTRELAVQVKMSCNQIFNKKDTLNQAVLIGGEPMMKQFMQLRANPRIIIGTPGRINDHLERKSLSLKETEFIVVDEADRMLDMGFGIQLDRIFSHLPKKRQTIMFSATLLPSVKKISEKYLQDPEYINENANVNVASKIKQHIVRVSHKDKFNHLVHELNQREGSIIVFVKTKRSADDIAHKLRDHHQSADAIHGDLRQRQRDQVIRNLRQHKNRILVATDIAARGIDIPHIRHVINYDLPHCAEDYVHRIGRTARANQEGDALSLITPEDNKYWKAIDRLINLKEPSQTHPRADEDLKTRRFNKNSQVKKKSFGFKNQAFSSVKEAPSFRTGKFSSKVKSSQEGKEKFFDEQKGSHQKTSKPKAPAKGPFKRGKFSKDSGKLFGENFRGNKTKAKAR